MIKTILITGGTGLVGKKLVQHLLDKGYTIHLLVRRIKNDNRGERLKQFAWDIYKRQIDKHCLTDVDAIIHLAGEEIARKRWTTDRKRQIIESRTESIRMIYDLMRKNKNQVEHVISASAVGYYGDRGEELLNENSLPSKDFLAETCIVWEEAVDEGEKFGLRIVKLRSAVILDAKGGILPQLALPLKFWLAVVPGSGKQWMPWIHIDDAVGIYTYALESKTMKGAYNMAAPESARINQILRAIKNAIGKRAFFIHIPKFLLQIVIGEMSLMVLESTRISVEKLKISNYQFKYDSLGKALGNLKGDI